MHFVKCWFGLSTLSRIQICLSSLHQFLLLSLELDKWHIIPFLYAWSLSQSLEHGRGSVGIYWNTRLFFRPSSHLAIWLANSIRCVSSGQMSYCFYGTKIRKWLAFPTTSIFLPISQIYSSSCSFNFSFFFLFSLLLSTFLCWPLFKLLCCQFSWMLSLKHYCWIRLSSKLLNSTF